MAIHGQTKKGLNKVLTYVKGLEAKVAALEGQVGGVVKETAEQKSARYAQEFETNITALAEKTGVTLTSEQAAEIADEAMIRMDHAKRKGDQVPSIKTLAEKSFKAFIANADDVISHAAADGYSAAVRAQKKGITEKRTGSPTGKTQADYDGMEIRDLARLCVREDAARRSK